ncbi:hypothetical protein VN1192_12330 [Helicobacter pylori]|nr:hypothetical protein VN1192_12330 [Helicobacter pylori]
MLKEKAIKIIPSVLFLFCLLQIFELVLVIGEMNKTEKLEAQIKTNLKMLESIASLLNEHLEGMELEHLKHKGVKIK